MPIPSIKVSPKVNQMRTQASKKVQQATKSQKFANFLLFLLLIGLPVFSIALIIVSFEVARRPIDPAADARLKEVHDKHVLGVLLAFSIFCAFFTLFYTLNDKIKNIKFFKMIFIFINVGIAFSMMVIAADAIKKVKDSGKDMEYKKYIDILGYGVIGVSLAILVVMGVYGFAGPNVQAQQGKTPVAPAAGVGKPAAAA